MREKERDEEYDAADDGGALEEPGDPEIPFFSSFLLEARK